MFKNKEEFVEDYRQRIEERYGRSVEQSHKTERYIVLGEMIRDYTGLNWKESKELIAKQQDKQVYYFSMEFLIGKLMKNNLMNLGIHDLVRDGLAEMGINLEELEELEADAGLGNGGLGRLAACFMDSLATLNYPGNGNCIRYQYGLFRQRINAQGEQEEVPDQWLTLGNVWEVRKPKHAVDVKFWGKVEVSMENGKMVFHHEDAEHVLAVPYDVPLVGQNTKQTNTLRLWSAEASENLPKDKDFRKYLAEIQEICLNVYPDDSTEEGKMLRLKQQYFFVCAGIEAIVKDHLRHYPSLDNLGDKIAIQLNDTHPVLAIPELMRVLMDNYGYSWEKAWDITNQVMSYTNHTVMVEALEKWPVEYVQKLLPRIWMIVKEINAALVRFTKDKYGEDFSKRVAIIKDDQIHMANLAVVGSHSINGVAALHSEIIRTELFKDYVEMWPNRFNNKTNGITPRRFLLYSNPELTQLLSDTIGPEFITNFEKIDSLMNMVDDPTIQERFLDVKHARKVILADYIKKVCGVEIDVNSIVDTQAKRLHAYKRQLMNILHVISLYQRMKADPNFKIYPRTFIFAAKAAPAYVFAKNVIRLINNVAKKVNADPATNKMLKVVFIPNYSVSVSEILMNASDVSEQISTAGKEASGTGNMKFMMNGAITLGTLDGANVEIDQLVGRENDVIFGMTVEEVEALRPTYDVWTYYNNNESLKKAIDSLLDGSWDPSKDTYKPIYDDLMFRNDEYMVCGDFEAYCEAQRKIETLYQDRSKWARACLINIAKSGFFSSDRTIRQYAEEIWAIKPVQH